MIRVSSPEADAFANITQRLRRYRSMVANYQACKELYDSLYPSGTGTLTDMPHGQQDTFEPERWAQRRWNQRDRIELSLIEMRTAYEDLERLVEGVIGDYHTVLIRRYFLNESYEIISEKMHFCKRQVIRYHNKAIEKIAEGMRK